MMLKIVKCNCSSCGHFFGAPSLGDGSYEEFLPWSRSGMSR